MVYQAHYVTQFILRNMQFDWFKSHAQTQKWIHYVLDFKYYHQL
jgi:hypothetical protein